MKMIFFCFELYSGATATSGVKSIASSASSVGIVGISKIRDESFE